MMSQKRQAIFIADLGFGDAGKGTITDLLTRRLGAHTVVRYNGGPQAAHNVVTPDGKHHTFSQFGSGMFLPWTKTLLSRFMLINPLNLLKEERHLRSLGVTDALARTLVDRRALVITPFHKAANRLRELARADKRHGSCGEGIGECMADSLVYGDVVLCAGDLQDRATLIKKMSVLRDSKYTELADLWPQLPDTEAVQQERAVFTAPTCIEDCADVYCYFADSITLLDEATINQLLAQPGTILFEGAQGVLLDENYGFAPYTTWSTTTFANAETFVREHDYSGEIIKLGLLRAYGTRHGAGPFPTEDEDLTRVIPDQHNTWNDWQQSFRVGHFDMVMARYARDVIGHLDYLAITNIDRLQLLPEWKVCTAYRSQPGEHDLAPYFEQSDERLTKIHVRWPAELSHQEKLTQRLWSCVPEYQIFSQRAGSHEDSSAYLAFLEEQLSTPIAISSDGPTAADKRCSEDFRTRVFPFESGRASR